MGRATTTAAFMGIAGGCAACAGTGSGTCLFGFRNVSFSGMVALLKEVTVGVQIDLIKSTDKREALTRT